MTVIDCVDTATGTGYGRPFGITRYAFAPSQGERPRYRSRNVIERLFGWLKEKRRFCTRYDKLAKSYRTMVTLAYIERCLRIYFSDKA